MHRHTALLGWVALALAAAALSGACSAGKDKSEFSGSSASGGSPNDGGRGGSGATDTGGGGSTFTVGPGGSGGSGGMIINPCGSECGPEELCEPASVAKDDDCDGLVDEGCPCTAGTAQACFKGDPSYLNDPGCFPGTMKCSELGVWGPCEGGLHADPDMCFTSNTAGCHPLSSVPFVTVDLKDGTGNFSMGALSESWTVQCPSGVNPCPAVSGTNPADDFTPVVSGEYTVTYTKTTSMGTEECTYPLFVGAPGLRVELSWEWDTNLGPDTVDIDLHLHKPNDVNPWGGTSGNEWDCAYSNCTASAFQGSFGPAPNWFTGVAPPQPVNWWLDPVFEKNTCYFGPKGNGQQWQSMGMGCHNPRLDIDNVYCDPTVTDLQDSDFCNAENINIDYPPLNEWTRIGVHYYSSHGQTYNVHPVVKVYCHGKLAAELGPTGYLTPITFTPADSSTRFWLVADVLFQDDECSNELCTVQPLYLDPNLKTPVLTTTSIVQQSVGPPYPPIPP